jgi:hypothetical protein
VAVGRTLGGRGRVVGLLPAVGVGSTLAPILTEGLAISAGPLVGAAWIVRHEDRGTFLRRIWDPRRVPARW